MKKVKTIGMATRNNRDRFVAQYLGKVLESKV